MLIALNKEDLIKLIKEKTLIYPDYTNPLIRKSGKYWGGFFNEWVWNKLNDFTEEELAELYSLIIKNDSYKNLY